MNDSKIKLIALGTCAGTEPIQGRRHLSFVIEIDGKLYWFDAGENCAYRASIMGYDLLDIRSIFISHPHMDHIGGFSNLLWNIRKLSIVKNKMPSNEIDVFYPDEASLGGHLNVLKRSEGGFKIGYKQNYHIIHEGLLFRDDNITVYALHNTHMQDEEPFTSYSFDIYAKYKHIIFSGDVGSYNDLNPLLEKGCDYLLCETGHYNSDEILKHLDNNGYTVGKLLYIHCGNDILNNYDEVVKKLSTAKQKNQILNDYDVIEL